jgi:hypothetical protein
VGLPQEQGEGAEADERDDNLKKDGRTSLHVRLIAVGAVFRRLTCSALPHTIAVIEEQFDPCRTAPTSASQQNTADRSQDSIVCQQ